MSASFQRDTVTFIEEAFLQSCVLESRPQSLSGVVGTSLNIVIACRLLKRFVCETVAFTLTGSVKTMCLNTCQRHFKALVYNASIT